MKHINVAIIGSGLSGVLCALSLKKIMPEAIIHIFEQHPEQREKGVAYSSALPYQPLNVIAARMSLFDDKPMHFVHWLQQRCCQGLSAEQLSETYQPRSTFAQYLHETFQPYAHGIITTNEEVTDLRKTPDGFTLTTASGRSNAQYVILATGNADPPPLKNTERYSGIIANQLRGFDINEALQLNNILIVGSGLTAVDLICSLHKLQFSGNIFVSSRRGLLPLPHVETHSTHHKVDFSDLAAPDVNSVLDYLIRVRHKISQHPDMPWQDILDNLRPMLPSLWQKLSLFEKELFMKKLRHFWEVHRHRMPLESQRIIEEMKQRGRLKIMKGEILQTKNKSVLLGKGTNISSVVFADMIINCTGQNSDITAQSSLLRNMHTQGLLQKDPLGLGVITQKSGEIIGTDHRKRSNIFAIGALRKYTDYECIAAREIKTQATDIAREIFNRERIAPSENIEDDFEKLVETAFSKDFSAYQHLVPPPDHIDENTYTRTLVYQGQYTVWLLVWGKKAVTGIHDHGSTETRVKVLYGNIIERKFKLAPDLVCISENTHAAGRDFRETEEDIHAIQCASPDYAVTLHVCKGSTPSLKGVKIYDCERKKVGELNDLAKRASWAEPTIAFESIASL